MKTILENNTDFNVKLEHYEWYEIYAASGQQQIR